MELAKLLGEDRDGEEREGEERVEEGEGELWWKEYWWFRMGLGLEDLGRGGVGWWWVEVGLGGVWVMVGRWGGEVVGLWGVRVARGLGTDGDLAFAGCCCLWLVD